MGLFRKFGEKINDMVTDKDMQVSSKRIGGLIIILVSIPTIYWIIWWKIELPNEHYELLKWCVSGGVGLLGISIAEIFKK